MSEAKVVSIQAYTKERLGDCKRVDAALIVCHYEDGTSGIECHGDGRDSVVFLLTAAQKYIQQQLANLLPSMDMATGSGG